MNVLQILPSLDVGGVETGTVDLARYLTRNGHKAIVVSSGGRLVEELESAGARHYVLPVGRKSLVNGLRMVRSLVEIIRREDIDIVHARSRIPAMWAYVASKITRRIFITTAHGYYKKHMFSEVMGWGRFVIVASNAIARHMEKDFAVMHERIRLIPRGVDLTLFKLKSPEQERSQFFTIGMIARITPLKGHSDFIKAVAIMKRRIPNLRVLVIGDAPKPKYREDLEILTRRLGLSSVVEFLGSRSDVPLLLSGLDVLVSATVTPEAFGRAVIEAQAVGVNVVATRVGGVVDIIEDGKTGLLCEPLNPADIAEKVVKLYEDETLRKSMAIEARKKVEELYNSELMMKRTVDLYKEAVSSTNILVIKISAIGDVILSVPSLRAIREKHPGAQIKVLVGIEAREVLDRCPYINDTIICNFKSVDKGLRGILKLGSILRNNCFDVVIDLQNNKKSHLLSALSLASHRYGYDNGKFSFLLNKRVKDDAPYLDPVEHQARVLRLAGIRIQDKKLELWPSDGDEKKIDGLLSESWVGNSQPLVGINVRASARWATKNWPAQYISQLCDKLAKEHNIRVVLTGSKGDVEYANQIASRASSHPIVVAGKTTILELASFIKRCRAYISPDSAPLHIAVATGTPVVALFGPTDPARHMPCTDDAIVFFKTADSNCRPCYNPRCHKNIKCMRKITVEDVANAVSGIIAGVKA